VDLESLLPANGSGRPVWRASGGTKWLQGNVENPDETGVEKRPGQKLEEDRGSSPRAATKSFSNFTTNIIFVCKPASVQTISRLGTGLATGLPA